MTIAVKQRNIVCLSRRYLLLYRTRNTKVVETKMIGWFAIQDMAGRSYPAIAAKVKEPRGTPRTSRMYNVTR